MLRLWLSRIAFSSLIIKLFDCCNFLSNCFALFCFLYIRIIKVCLLKKNRQTFRFLNRKKDIRRNVNSSYILPKPLTFFFCVITGNKPTGENATWNTRQGKTNPTCKIVSMVVLYNSSNVSGAEDLTIWKPWHVCFSAMLSGWISVRRLGPKERVQHSRDTAGVSLRASNRWLVINTASGSATGESTVDRSMAEAICPWWVCGW